MTKNNLLSVVVGAISVPAIFILKRLLVEAPPYIAESYRMPLIFLLFASIFGIVLGARGMKLNEQPRWLSTTGVVLCTIAVIITFLLH